MTVHQLNPEKIMGAYKRPHAIVSHQTVSSVPVADWVVSHSGHCGSIAATLLNKSTVAFSLTEIPEQTTISKTVEIVVCPQIQAPQNPNPYPTGVGAAEGSGRVRTIF
ncbi:hypothetical protein ACIPIN_23920 [Pseudomonas sp. NPDC087697]|uniref:hypothetical protein n=1 Tax=Pseudomonas sp. NPDC087697 TaxID=3364447 RepID=UPI0038140D63